MKKITLLFLICLTLFSINYPPFLKSDAKETFSQKSGKVDTIDYTALYKACQVKKEKQMETLISMASTPDTIVKFKFKTITDTFLLTKFDTIVIQKGIFGRSKVIQNTSIIDYEFEDTDTLNN